MSSTSKIVRTLVQSMRTLDKMSEEHTIWMKLIYYNDITDMRSLTDAAGRGEGNIILSSTSSTTSSPESKNHSLAAFENNSTPSSQTSQLKSSNSVMEKS